MAPTKQEHQLFGERGGMTLIERRSNSDRRGDQYHVEKRAPETCALLRHSSMHYRHARSAECEETAACSASQERPAVLARFLGRLAGWLRMTPTVAQSTLVPSADAQNKE